MVTPAQNGQQEPLATVARQAQPPNPYEGTDSSIDDLFDTPVVPNPATRQPVVTAPQHSRRAVQMAQDFGLTDEEIASYNPETLDAVVYNLHRQHLQSQRDARRQDVVQSAFEPQPRLTPPPAPSGTPGHGGGTVAEEEFNPGLEGPEWDPALVAAIKKAGSAGAATKKEIQELKAMLARSEQRSAQVQQEQHVDLIERTFVALEKRVPGLVGQGRGTRMDQTDPAFKRRLAILQVADTLQGPYPQRMVEACKTLFGNVARQPELPRAQRPQPQRRSDGTFGRDAWNDAGLAIPTSRSGAPEPPGEAKAVRTAARYMQENNLGDYDDMIEEGFLD